MTMNYTPVFKKRDVVVKYPVDEGINFGAHSKQVVAEVMYVGEQVEKYKVGDKVLFVFAENFGKKLDMFGELLFRIENEDQIICQVIENGTESV